MKVKQEPPNSPQTLIPLPPRMRSMLKQYRLRVWIIKLTEGISLAVFGLVISYLFVFILDRIIDTSALVRTFILAAGCVGLFLLFPLKCYKWVWNQRRLDQVARLVRHKYPRFGDHLLGIVELVQTQSNQDMSRPLLEAAVRQVDTELVERNLNDAVPKPKHWQWVWMAGLSIALFVLVMVTVPDAGRNAMTRWLMPWAEVERYTFTQLVGNADLRVVAYAEPFEAEVGLKQESLWKPESAKAIYKDQSAIIAARKKTTYTFDIPPQTEHGHLSIFVGDAYRAIPVEPKVRPALTDLIAEIELPSYLHRLDSLIVDARGGTISLLTGSSAVFKATATRDLVEAEFDGKSLMVQGSTLTSGAILFSTSAQYNLTWRDKYGLETGSPQVLQFETIEDKAPVVSINKLKNHQILISNEVLTFDLQAGDDYGVKQVGLEWEGIHDPTFNPLPSKGEKLVAAGAPNADSMSVTSTFSAELEGVRPQSLRIRAFVEDYLPDRERAYSPYIVLHVFSSAEHYKWLTEQLSIWMNSAHEVYDKELQLHKTNEELSQLPPEALDDPAKRTIIQNQAAVEKENASKLNHLVDEGKELVKEALKNEEFDPEQLDTWAKILLNLEAIAQEKMPSVAELLVLAAESQGQPSEPPEDSMNAPLGGQLNDQPKSDQDGPEGPETEGLGEAPKDPNNPGVSVNADRSKQSEGKPGYHPANPIPSVLDIESGFNETEKAGNAPQAVGGMGIPVTMLKGSQNSKDEEPAAEKTAELVQQAVEVQEDLLESFASLSDDISKLLLGFENSTFVNRLKAASRRQIDIAAELDNLDGFGLEADAVDNHFERENIAAQQITESETVLYILEDLAAYANRKPSQNITMVIEDMQSVSISKEINAIADAIHENYVGQSAIEGEFWADSLDRWAEQLVDPLEEDGGEPQEMEVEILPNLPPKIIVEVMRVINREMQLREETRELEQSRNEILGGEYIKRAAELSLTQQELAEKSREIVEQIKLLPNAAEELIQAQLKKIANAVVVMNEVVEILDIPDTGSKAIAAISEVIEILLETTRVPNAPMLMKAPPTTAFALTLIGMGDDTNQAFIESRTPNQSTGNTGRELPEEFRQGLDVYFEALEGKPLRE